MGINAEYMGYHNTILHEPPKSSITSEAF